MASMDVDFIALKQRLVAEDAFILKIIDTIPSKLYFDQDVQGNTALQNHMTLDQGASDFVQASGRSSSRLEPSSRNKHNRVRLDPSQNKSISEIQKEACDGKKNKKNLKFMSTSLARAANIEELQKRLQERIRELQGKRKGITEAVVQETKRLKKKVKKMKIKKRSNRKNVAEHLALTPSAKRPKLEKPDLRSKPIYNQNGKVIYSKFDFTDTAENFIDGKMTKTEGGKSLKKLLNEVKREGEKIESIKEKNKEKAHLLIERKAWRRAIMKAEGVKVRDDPSLLKKSLKRQEKRKTKSAKEWQQRKERTENSIKKKQDKRRKNIQAKKQGKIDKKIKRAKKKGHIIPGF